MRFLTNILAKAGLIVDGTTQLNTIANATTDTDKFLVSDSGVVKYRTGAQVLSDIGAASAAGYVPYTGATQSVSLGEYGLNSGFITLDTTPTGTPTSQGTIHWDATKSTAALIMNGTTQHIGQDMYFYVKNSTGTSIPKGTAVRFAGTEGASGHILIAPFLADGTYPSNYFMGVTSETIANGAFGQVVHFGELEGINTSSYTAGSILYASTSVAGGFQTTAPSAPNNIVVVAAALNSKNNGAIIVRPTYGSNINDDEGVLITSPVNNHGLFYDSTSTLWVNKTIPAALGYTPVNTATTITINGQTYDLSTNRVWSVGTVTSVNMTVPTGFAIGGNPVTSAGTLALTFASGYSLPTNASQTNWDTAYTNRITSLTTTGTSGAATLSSNVLNIPQYQAQGNYITALTGEATASGPGSASVTLSNSAVTGKVLTGLTVTGTSISSTDSILTAFGKLQGQVNALTGGLQYQGTWNASTNTPTITSGSGTDGHFYIVSVAGSTNIDGVTDWQVGDWIVFHSPVWQKVDNTDSVTSVNGFTGAVTLTTTNISEGTNLYYTNARARAAITLTTTGSSGAATYSSGTGVLNVPQYTLSGLGGVPTTRSLTINGTAYDLSADRTWSVGTVTSIATSGPITGGTITGSGTIGITQATSSTSGYLSSTDWNTFNNKQNALTLTTTGSSGAATLVGATLNIPNYTISGLNGVPTSRILTINGIGLDLSADRSWSVGTVSGTGTANYVARWTGANTLSTGVLYDNGTNVGIGTTSPQTSITISRTNVSYAGQLQIASDNFSQISFYNSSALTPSAANRKASIIYNIPDGTFELANQITNGSLILQGTDSGGGNVLIGTTTNVGYKLDVAGQGRFNTSAQPILILNSYNASGGYVNLQKGSVDQLYIGPSTVISGVNTNVDIWATSGNGLAFYTNGSTGNYLRIATSGAATFSSSVTATSFVKTGGTSTQYLMADGSVSTLTNPTTGTGTANYIPKFTSSTAIGNSQIFDNGTNVGIGTVSAIAKLTVEGDGSVNTYAGTLRIANTAASRWSYISLPDTQTGTSNSNNYYIIGRGNLTTDRVMSFHIPYAADYGTGAQPKFGFYSTGADLLHSIEASTGTAYFKGTVLIGTTIDAGYKVDVNGSTRITGQLLQGSGAARSTNGTTVSLTVNAAFSANTDIADGNRFLSIVNNSSTSNAFSALSFRINPDGGTNNAMLDIKLVNGSASNNTSTLYWTFNSTSGFNDRMWLTSTGNLTIAGTLTEQSTLRYKENIAPVTAALEKVDQLQPVSYNKKGSSTKEIGLIAEDVFDVYPEFVLCDDDGEPVGIHYSRLTAVLIESVKELKKEINELKSKN
jgi:predicted heme/steroid binding protein